MYISLDPLGHPVYICAGMVEATVNQNMSQQKDEGLGLPNLHITMSNFSNFIFSLPKDLSEQQVDRSELRSK